MALLLQKIRLVSQSTGSRKALLRRRISFQYFQSFASVLPSNTHLYFETVTFGWVTSLLSVFQLRKVPLVRLGRDPQVKEASGVNICNMVILTQVKADHTLDR